MRTLKRNKQNMYYSQRIGYVDVYEKDDFGNIKYTEIEEDGEIIQIPIPTGEKELTYGAAIPFRANINGKLNDAIIRAFGVDNSDNHAQITSSKNAFPFVVGTRIWLNSEVLYKDEDKSTIDQDSADYEVRGVLREGLNEDLYYLVVLNHED